MLWDVWRKSCRPSKARAPELLASHRFATRELFVQLIRIDRLGHVSIKPRCQRTPLIVFLTPTCQSHEPQTVNPLGGAAFARHLVAIELRHSHIEDCGVRSYALGRVQGRLAKDPTRLQQCVVNLLANAAKYTDRGGEIKVQVGAAGRSAIVTVWDTGIGITAELLSRVFDLFVQGDRALDRSQGGLGVGLAVVKRLIEMHQGEVSARSAGAGRGATFEIRLPLAERPASAQGSARR